MMRAIMPPNSLSNVLTVRATMAGDPEDGAKQLLRSRPPRCRSRSRLNMAESRVASTKSSSNEHEEPEEEEQGEESKEHV